MENKKVIILIVLTVFAVISLIYGITAIPKGRAVRAAVSQRPSPDADTYVAKTLPSSERRFKRSKFTSWRRSPFVPVSTAATSKLVLSGIAWNKDKPKAMIGDAIVMKGDEIDGNKVIDIKPDRIILNDGTKDFELKI